VQTPVPRGNDNPEMASRTEDFPEASEWLVGGLRQMLELVLTLVTTNYASR